jgi:hypothetical protein
MNVPLPFPDEGVLEGAIEKAFALSSPEDGDE